MEFTVALTKVYNTTKKKEQLADPFVVFSRVSDLIGDSYNDKKKAELFFRVSKRINLFALTEDLGKKCKSRIAKKYETVSDVISVNTFNKIADIVYDIVYPSEKKPAKKPQTVAVKKATVKKAQSEHKTETRTPLGKKTLFGGCSNAAKKAIRTILNIIGIALVVLVVGAAVNGMIYAIKNIPWSVWQWIIGVAVSLVLCVTVSLVGGWLDDETICDYYVFGTFVLYFFTVANFILKVVFAEYCLAFFVCAAVPIFVIGLGLVYNTFDYCEDGWGWAQIIAIALDCIFTAIVFIFNVA